MAAGSLTLGGNMSLALGPLGRNGEASGALNTDGKIAAMCVQIPLLSPNRSDRCVSLCRYSYSKTRGLFGGVSVEGSVIMERQDANFQAYDSPVTARMLLGGNIDPPDWALPLIKTLEACTGMPGGREWINDDITGTSGTAYAFGGMASPSSRVNMPSFLQRKKKPDTPVFPPATWQSDNQSDPYFTTAAHQSHSRNHTWDGGDYPSYSTSKTSYTSNLTSPQRSSKSPSRPLVSTNSSLENLTNPFSSSSDSFSQKSSMYSNQRLSTAVSSSKFPFKDDPVMPKPFIKPREELTRPLLPHEGVGRAVALYDFKAVEVVNSHSCVIIH